MKRAVHYLLLSVLMLTVEFAQADEAEFAKAEFAKYHRLVTRTHAMVNSITMACTGSNGLMSVGGGIDRKNSHIYQQQTFKSKK